MFQWLRNLANLWNIWRKSNGILHVKLNVVVVVSIFNDNKTTLTFEKLPNSYEITLTHAVKGTNGTMATKCDYSVTNVHFFLNYGIYIYIYTLFIVSDIFVMPENYSYNHRNE